MKYGLWSENSFISIPDDAFNAVLISLQKTLSISVPLVFENLVGSVMDGYTQKRLCNITVVLVVVQ